jgi:hypothetical protein
MVRESQGLVQRLFSVLGTKYRVIATDQREQG